MPRIRLSPSLLLFLLAFATLTVSCRSPQIGEEVTVTIETDGTTREVKITAGSTVTQAFQAAGIALGNLDRTEPPLYTVLNNGDTSN